MSGQTNLSTNNSPTANVTSQTPTNVFNTAAAITSRFMSDPQGIKILTNFFF